MTNKTTLHFILLSVLLFFCGKSYGGNWEKKYEVNGRVIWGFAVEAYDKGFYMGGTDDAAPNCIRVYKTDINGNVLWKRILGKGLKWPTLGGMAVTLDGGIVLTGAIFNDSDKDDNFLLKINACGKMEWCKIYALNQYSIGGPVGVLKNGDYIVSSYINIVKDTIPNYYNSWIFRTDAKGNIKWQNFDNLFLHSVNIDKDENILSTGEVDLPYPDNPWYRFIKSGINKTDTSGKRIWASEYSREKHIDCQGAGSSRTRDGGYLTFGTRRDLPGINCALFLIKHNGNGMAEWDKLIGDLSLNIEGAQNMIAIDDSTYLCIAISCKNSQHNYNLGDLKLIKINDRGDILKQVIYPNRGFEWSFYYLFATSDGKFTIPGIAMYNVVRDSIMVLKVNKDLEPDSFYKKDTNKYDYKCGEKIALDSIIYFTSDTVHITIPFPEPDTTQPQKPGSFLVYPNPSSGQIQIRCAADNNNVKVILYDMLGREINKYSFVPGDTGHGAVNLGNISPGCYIITLAQGGKWYVQKLIVE